MILFEAKFKEGDYIINPTSGDMGIVKGITKKGYYQFKEFYGGMFKELKEMDKYNLDLQVNYQKFYRLCTEEEKKNFDEIIEKQKRG